MGCDIHMYSETLTENGWELNEPWSMVENEWEEGGPEVVEVDWNDQIYSGRDYDLFGILAGVRSDNQMFEVNGFPEDASEQVAEIYKRWDCDAHTPSHLTLEELKQWADDYKDHKTPVSGMMQADQFMRLKTALDNNDPNWQEYLYPYCQGTNADDYVDFSIDLPTVEFVGFSILKIIETLENNGKDGDKRIVFWFDN